MALTIAPVIGFGTSCANTGSSAGSTRPAAAGADKAMAAVARSGEHLKRLVLDNGMVCLINEDRSAPVASVQIWVGTGSIHENEYLGAGLSHAIEHMIFKGTEKRGPTDITRDINNAGGDINAYTSLDRTVFHTDLPARNWKIGLDVLADAVMNATFPEAEWKQEKNVILREFSMGNDDPERVVDKMLWRTAYIAHPYRFPVIGYEDIFRRNTRADLVAFFKRNYVPDNMILVIVGDIDSADAEKTVRETFAEFKRKARPPVVLPVEPPQLSPRIQRETGAYKVARLNWAYHTVPMSHPDAPALDMLAQVTGSGRSATLVRKIQENLKLVHNINSWSYTPREGGLFGVSAIFDADKEKQVLKAVEAEINTWLTVPFSNEEIEKARRMMLNSVLTQQQTMQGQASAFASGEYYAGDPMFAVSYLEKLNSITPRSLMDVAVRYLRPDGKSIVVLAPEDASKKQAGRAEEAKPPVVKRLSASNGMKLIVREDRRLPLVYFCASLSGGVLTESDANNGITRLMSDLLVRGTKTRSREQIAELTEAMGAQLSPYSGLNGFGLRGQCLDRDADKFMEIFADCLLNSTFPDQEVARQREIQLSSIDEEQERPFELARESLRQLLFPGHPYRWSPLGTKDIVKKLSGRDILSHYSRHVVTSNIVISIFGDIGANEAKQLVDKHLASVRRGESPARHNGLTAPKLPARTKRREPKEQAILLLGFPGVTVKDPNFDALQVLHTAISGLSSDLGIEVREKRGLAYYVGSYNHAGVEPGAFVFYAGTREDAADEVEKLMTNEVRRISSSGLRKEELDRARNQLIADFEMSLQDNSALTMNAALDELYGLGFEHAFNAKQRFEAVTSEDVRKAAASIMVMDKSAVSLLLPEKPSQ